MKGNMTDQELKEQAEVMLAYANAPADKKPVVQFVPKQFLGRGGRWADVTDNCVIWSLDSDVYRIKPSPIAPGHNPDKLTVEQVGVADGYRLLSEEEISFHIENGTTLRGTDWWSCGHWRVNQEGWYAEMHSTLRTKNPPGHYLPKPKIAEGHNPDKLTVDQIPEGHRLMTREEVLFGEKHPSVNRRAGSGILAYEKSCGKWLGGGYWGNSKGITYCVPIDWKDPIAPKKLIRKPCGPEHFPYPTLVKARDSGEYEYYLVSGVECESIWLSSSVGHKFGSVHLMSYLRSLDNGKTWLPCYVEVEK